MTVADLYETYHIARQDERLQLFTAVCEHFGVQRGLYPGCFVHVTPSFVIPAMYYVDSDRRAQKFFTDGFAAALARERRAYPSEPEIRFFRQSYEAPLPIPDQSVDLLISQYAGFVSHACLQYLRRGGYLVANNSHGDAGLAWSNPELELVAVVQRRGERFSVSTDRLSEYFIPKSPKVPRQPEEAANHIRSLGRGIGYTKTASNYVFRRS
jgi:hypothetical protein